MALSRFLSEQFGSKGLAEIVRPENLRSRKLKPQHSAASDTQETFTFEIPTDRLIHAILIRIAQDTNADGFAGAGDHIESIDLNSNIGHLKEMLGSMAKQIGIINKEVMSTGFYKLYFTDPVIKRAMPLPSWLFSSLGLDLTDVVPSGTEYSHIQVSLIESEVPSGLDVSDWRILCERYLRWKHYGTDTGWMDYDHERAYRNYGYLYTVDDAGTLSDTEFDMLTLIGIKPDGEHRLVDEQYMTMLKESNTVAYHQALATGYFYQEFPNGYDSGQYRSLISKLNIPSAATNAGLRVLERYLM